MCNNLLIYAIQFWILFGSFPRYKFEIIFAHAQRDQIVLK